VHAVLHSACSPSCRISSPGDESLRLDAARGLPHNRPESSRHRTEAAAAPGRRVIGKTAAIAESGVAAGAATQNRTIRPEFTGAAGEYFRIWIVNLFFTLVTLGVYSAWAKVRKKKYFYGNTRLDGDSFDYFGNPKAILKGRIIAIAAFVLYALAGELYPASRYAFWGLALLLLPWLIVRALTFNARNSAYRGLRFDFTATAKDAAWVYIGKLAVVALTLGFVFPWFMARQKAFVVSHHAFGTTRFACELPARRFFGIYIRAGLILSAAGAVLGGLSALLLPKLVHFGSLSWIAFVLPAILLYAGYAVSYAYMQSRTTNLLWANTLGPGLRFESTLAAAGLTRLYVGNLFAVACSAGLLIPWAVVRTLRYRLENFAMILEEEVVHEASPALAPVGAAGQELGDIFNLDFGL